MSRVARSTSTDPRGNRLFDSGGRMMVDWYDLAPGETFSRSVGRHHWEMCVNFSGQALLWEHKDEISLGAFMLSCQSGSFGSAMHRLPGGTHRFLTIISQSRVGKPATSSLTGTWVRLLEKHVPSRSQTFPLTPALRKIAEEMVSPPVMDPAMRQIWYPAKILELTARLFSNSGEPVVQERQKLLALERVDAVKTILLRDVENPPSLGDLAREVGCSPFYLSRLFSEETGTTISRWLRTTRLELAAERLRSGKFNVTEAAMSVGYSSLSHFSKAFAAQFGHCPCVFPLHRSPQ